LEWVTIRHSLAPWPRGINFPACDVSPNKSKHFNKPKEHKINTLAYCSDFWCWIFDSTFTGKHSFWKFY
jgi:hypothetical protein